jgi:hypothetical protein
MSALGVEQTLAWLDEMSAFDHFGYVAQFAFVPDALPRRDLPPPDVGCGSRLCKNAKS